MTMPIETGQIGEQLALKYLKENGFEILETNWRSGSLELDIVGKKAGFLVIVEVKTRSGKPLLEPEIAVDYGKQKSLIKAANKYITMHNIEFETRFDIIGITLQSGDQYHVHHIEDAFYPRLQR